MVVRDLFGNSLSTGDTVSFALGPGSFLLGKMEKVSTGLDGNPPVAFVTVAIPVPIHPSGLVQGVIYVKVEEEKKILE